MVCLITGAEFYVSVTGKSMKVRELAVVSRSVSLLVVFFMLLGTAIDRHRGRQLTGLSKPGKSCGADVCSQARTSSTQRSNSVTPTQLTSSFTPGITPSSSELQKRLGTARSFGVA